MSDTVISVENVSKIYRLGEVGTGSLAHDVNRWWHRVRGKEDPYLKVGQVNDRTKSLKGSSKEKGQPDDWVYALKDINFEVKKGEVLGIIGRNGAGKSTLLKILSRVTTQSSGRIKVKGRIASLLEVGTGFHPELTGRENIFLNGAILGMRRAEIASKFDEIVEFSGCARYIDTPVKRYSSGMYVRLAFAVAAHLEPETLIVDEVLAVGDASFQKQCQEKMRIIANAGTTVLIVSHNLDIVTKLCSRAILLQNGTLTHEGHVKDALEKYNESKKSKSDSGNLRNANRTGDKTAQFTKIEIFNQDKDITRKIKSGEPIQIRLEIESTQNLDDIGIAIAFSCITNHRVITTWNRETGDRINLKPGINTVICSLSNLPLRPGHKLWLGLWLEYSGIVADTIEFAEEIEGDTTNKLTSQLSTDSMQGTLTTNFEWSSLSGLNA